MEQYKFHNRIGEGAHGVVYLGQAVRTGERVALKKIPIKKLNAGLPKELIREIQAMRQTSRAQPEIEFQGDHATKEERGAQHVLKLRDVFAAGSAVVLATDLMEGTCSTFQSKLKLNLIFLIRFNYCDSSCHS